MNIRLLIALLVVSRPSFANPDLSTIEAQCYDTAYFNELQNEELEQSVSACIQANYRAYQDEYSMQDDDNFWDQDQQESQNDSENDRVDSETAE